MGFDLSGKQLKHKRGDENTFPEAKFPSPNLQPGEEDCQHGVAGEGQSRLGW